jgi:hypothetical protein
MSVQATAINDDKGILVFTEVRAETMEAAQQRADRVCRNLGKAGREPIGIGYDTNGLGTRRVRLLDGTELSWNDFLANHGLKDEGFAVKPSEINHSKES